MSAIITTMMTLHPPLIRIVSILQINQKGKQMKRRLREYSNLQPRRPQSDGGESLCPQRILQSDGGEPPPPGCSGREILCPWGDAV